MALYTKESLETLKERIDLIDVIESHVELKRSGAHYKAPCPFHDEKTPSFSIQKGDRHYHCFGCGAHGDAIEFLMSFLKVRFVDAVEMLAERFHVHLDKIEDDQSYKGPRKQDLKSALEAACRFYQLMLLQTEEGRVCLDYLFQRGIDLRFIELFRIGYAPNSSGVFRKVIEAKGFSKEILQTAGLLTDSGRDFFSDRITFPIQEPSGAVIGFSCRKYKDSAYGGKYINTRETPLFKKSKILFGLNYSRRQIAKKREAIIVEGQVDALRLIDAGFETTVAGQGTAFGEGHVQELLLLGVQKVFLVMDSDTAGQEACAKIGNLFQKKAVHVKVVCLPEGKDPDEFIRSRGSEAFQQCLDRSQDFIAFLIAFYAKRGDPTTPAGKNALVHGLVQQIRTWESDLMVHESLRVVSELLQVPKELVGLGAHFVPNLHIQKHASIGDQKINPQKILEMDFIRWLLHKWKQTQFMALAKENLVPDDLADPVCRKLYQKLLDGVTDQLSLAEDLEVQELLNELSKKIVNVENAEKAFVTSIQKILERNWMEKREAIKQKIHSGNLSDEEALLQLKELNQLTGQTPKVNDAQALSVL